MKAIITTLPGKSVLQEVPMPEMNEDSVLIQLKYCGVCYSEHYEWKTNGGAFGHEPMGTIVQVGKNVEGFSVGDRVSGLWGSTLPGAGGMVQYAVANPSKDTVVKLGFPPLNREATSNRNTYGSRCPAVAGLWCGGVSSGTGVSVFAAAVPNSSL